MADELLTCPVCGGAAAPGNRERTVPVNVSALYFSNEEARRAPRGPMRLAACPSCGMVFNSAFDAAALTYDGAYDNSLDNSPVFRRYSEQLAARLVNDYALRRRTVVEIGCGQGGFLRQVCAVGGNQGHGFDPSYTGPPSGGGVTIHQRLYGEGLAVPDTALVICRHVLEHIAQPAPFLRQVRQALAGSEQAVLYFEVPNAASVLTRTGLWDVIYPHCSYFSEAPLRYLFEHNGFEVLRSGAVYDNQFLYLEARPAAPGRAVSADKPACGGAQLEEFADTVDRTITAWASFLQQTGAAGRKVAFWGAGAKGTTFLNMVPGADGIGTVVDLNPRKHGAYVPGTGQRVEDTGALAAARPEVVVTLNPIYAQEIEASLRSMGVTAELVVGQASRPVHLD